MGFFNKLFGQKEKVQKEEQAFPEQPTLPSLKMEEELIEQYGGIAFEKQLYFSEVIGSNPWSVDMQKGEMSFGTALHFPIQVLGTFSYSSSTWLWAWANTQSGLSERILTHALQLKNYGEINGLDIFKVSEFEATKDDLHAIGLIASGMFNANAYYIADYGKGAMLVTISSNKIDKMQKENHYQILTVFPQLIAQFHIDHRKALISYLSRKDYKISNVGNTLSAEKNESTITAEFDGEGRLTKLNG